MLVGGCALPAITMLYGYGGYSRLLPALAIAAMCGALALARFGAAGAVRSAVATAAAASHLLVLAPLAIGVWDRQDWQRDTPAYFLAIERARSAEPLYAELPEGPHRIGDPQHFLYPPFFAAVGSLAPASDYMTFNRAWLAIALVAFWGFAACLAVLVAGRAGTAHILVAGLVLAAVPGSLSAIIVGQADPLLWCLAGLALAAPRLSGVGLTLVASVKLYAGWPVLFGLLRRDRALVFGTALTSVVLVALGAHALGPARLAEETRRWLEIVMPALSQGQFEIVENPQLRLLAWVTSGNFSLAFLPLHAARAAGWDPGAGDLPGAIRLYLLACGVGAPLLAGVLTQQRHRVVQYAIVLAAAAVFAPVFRASYAPILLLVPAALLMERRINRSAREAPKPAVWPEASVR